MRRMPAPLRRAGEVAGGPLVSPLEVGRVQRVHQVVRGVAPLHRGTQRLRVGDVPGDGGPGAAVRRGTTGHRADLVPGGVERGAQSRTHEPGRAGDQNPHVVSCPPVAPSHPPLPGCHTCRVHASTALCPVQIGRGDEVTVLAEHLDALATTGAGTMLLIAGEAGVGKSRLVGGGASAGRRARTRPAGRALRSRRRHPVRTRSSRPSAAASAPSPRTSCVRCSADRRCWPPPCSRRLRRPCHCR